MIARLTCVVDRPSAAAPFVKEPAAATATNSSIPSQSDMILSHSRDDDPRSVSVITPVGEGQECGGLPERGRGLQPIRCGAPRSEEHTSELQSLMRISSAVFCSKKKNDLIYASARHRHK